MPQPVPASNAIKVFVVDSQEVVRRGVANLIGDESDLQLVGEAETAEEAVTLVPRLRPDVVICEARLLDDDGLRLCKALRDALPELRCLLFTEVVDPKVIGTALLGGMDGFVSKTSSGASLISGIRRVAAGQPVVEPVLARPTLVGRSEKTVPTGPLDTLTPNERALVDLVGQAKSNKEIAEAMGISQKTVKNRLSHVLHKLGFTSRTEMAVFVVRQTTSPDSDRPRVWRSTG